MGEFLTSSLEDYLEIIYIIQSEGKGVRITDIANALSFSKASVNQAINTLKSEKLVLQEKYGKIALTDQGFKIAESIYEKHKVLSRFFIEVLGVSPLIGEIDACKAEHVLSSETLKGIKNFLSKLEV